MPPIKKLFLRVVSIWAILGITHIQTREIKPCKPLELPRNAEMNCRNEETRLSRMEYTCTYKCKKHYTPHESNGGTTQEHKISCDSTGQWRDLQKFRSFTCREDCGRTPLKSTLALVVHGKATNTSSWPWHASIFQKVENVGPKNKTLWVYICGGSLIRDSVILSAAHCVTQNGKLINSDQFKVVLGAETSNYAANVGNRNSQEFGIRRMFTSPNYDSKNHDGDIALLHLDGPGVRFSDHVIPICLPNDGAIDLHAIVPGRAGDVVGFGVDETGKPSLALKHAELTIASPAECFNSLNRIISVSQFCAGNKLSDERWVTVCNGDSGGGFAVPSAIHQRYFIHGIVSTGDSNSKLSGGVCRNHVVFTRVFQFIFWVRDVLERIHGEIIRELTASAKYPYILSGTETTYAHFTPIPRQWDNLVTSIQIEYATIEPETLYQSLQQNAGLENLNLTQIRLMGELKTGTYFLLPHIKSFVLDIPSLGCWADEKIGAIESACIDKDPAKLTKSQLKTLLFFYKDEADWPVENLYAMKTNVELTLHTSRVLQVDQEAGKLVCQTQFCSELLGRKGEEQILKYLALSKCDLNLGALFPRREGLFSLLRVLVLDKVNLRGGGLSDILSEAPLLDTVALIVENDLAPSEEGFTNLQTSEDKYAIPLSSIPKTVKHWGSKGISLKFDYAESNNVQQPPKSSTLPTFLQISFPGRRRSHSRQKRAPSFPTFPRLQTFVCDACELDVGIRENFAQIFPNLKRLIFVGQLGINITELLEKMTKLNYIVFINVETELDDVGFTGESTTAAFIGLEKFPAKESTSEFLLSNTATGWRRMKLKYRPENVLHKFFLLDNFWTSFEEFEADSRLTSFEKVAYNTGKYEFRPHCATSLGAKCDKFHRMPKIPRAIQNALKSVEVENVEVIPGELLGSLHSAYELESLILNKVRLLGYFVNFLELPNLREYRLHAVTSSENFVDQTSNVYGAKLYIPFGQSPEGTQGGSRRYDAIPGPDGGNTKMESFQILFDNCKVLVLDYVQGEFISTPKVARDILPHLRYTNLTTVALRLSETELSGLSVPPGVKYLDLRCKSEYEWNCSRLLTDLISPLNSIEELRLAQHHIYDEHELLGRTTFKLEDIGGSANSLRLLGIDEAHFEYSHLIPNFRKLKTVFFETCTFDPKLVERFFESFRSVNTVGISSNGYGKYGTESKESYLAVNRKILLAALKNKNVDKVVGNLGSREDVRGQMAEGADDLKKILSSAGVPKNNFHEFVLVRGSSGRWLSGHSVNTTFEEEVRTLRGDPIFGTRSCIQRLF